MQQIDVPVFGTRLTLGLAEVKLRQHGLLNDAQLHTITPDDVLELGPFTVEFFHVCHSIPDSVGVAVTTPVGSVVHSSDYKFDQHPVDGRLTDFAKLQALGERGVLLLLSDSTNAEVEGFTPSERELEDSLDRIFAHCRRPHLRRHLRLQHLPRRSGVSRWRVAHGRRLGLVGRSMRDNARMATRLDYLDVEPGELLTYRADGTAARQRGGDRLHRHPG